MLKRRNLSGFTIVELLVASAVTLVMVSLALKIVIDTSSIFDRTTGQLDTRSQAQRALDTLALDLQNSVLLNGFSGTSRAVTLIATIQPNQSGRGSANFPEAKWNPSNPKPGNIVLTTGSSISQDIEKPSTSLFLRDVNATSILNITDCRFGQAGMWLRFFTIQDNAGLVAGDTRANTIAPVAVAYQISRCSVMGNSEEFRYRLYRSVARSASDNSTKDARSVMAIGYDLADSDTAEIVGSPPPDYYNNPDLNANDPTASGAEQVEPGSLRRPDRGALLANNIIDFGVRFYDSTGLLIFPRDNDHEGFAVTSRAPGDLLKTGIGFDGLVGWANRTGVTGNPRYAELSVRAITEAGAKLLAGFEEGKSTPPVGYTKEEYWWKLAFENSQVFTRRVELPAR